MLATSKSSEIRLPYPLPQMKNPLWMLGFIALMGTTLLIYPYLNLDSARPMDAWVGFASLLLMLFCTGLFYGLASRIKTIVWALCVFLIPQTLVYAAVMLVHGMFVHHGSSNDSWPMIQAALMKELLQACFASAKVSVCVGIFLAVSLRMRIRPAYDLTARLFLLSGGWLMFTTILGLFFYRKGETYIELSLLNFAVSVLFVALSYWQNLSRAIWYRRVAIGMETAWQCAALSPTQGFLLPLFHMKSSVINQASVTGSGNIPLVAVPLVHQDLFRALRPRNFLSIALIVFGVLGFFTMAFRLVAIPLQ